MTQKEFTDRTGLEVSAQEFEKINEKYIASSLQEDAFCADYVKHADSLILDDFYSQRQLYRDLYRDIKPKTEQAAVAIIRKAADIGDHSLYEIGVSLIGQKEATLLMIREALPLFENDRRYIETALTK
jgi:hypothetical protein